MAQERLQEARLEELETRLVGKVDAAIAVIKQAAGKTNPDDVILKTVMQVAEGSATKVGVCANNLRYEIPSHRSIFICL